MMLSLSSGQPFPALPIAEAGLISAVEAITVAGAMDSIIPEHEKGCVKMLQVGSHLLREPRGAWRTRHLRLKSQYARWMLANID